MVLDTLVRSAAPEIGKRVFGEGVQKLTRESLQQGAGKLSKESLQQGMESQGRNIDNIMKNLNPETPAKMNELLDESDIKMIADVADTHPERSQELLGDFEHWWIDKEPDNFKGGLLKMSHDYRNSISKSQIEAPVPKKDPISPSEDELAGLEERYIASKNDIDHDRLIQDGLEQEEGIQSARAGIQRAKDRGSAGGEETFKRKLRETKGTAGSYVEEGGKEFVAGRQEMQGRLVQADSYGVHRKTDPDFPGKKPLSKEDHAALKRKEGLEALIEQHHMMSAYDSSVLADQLGKLGHRFKYNAYMYILKTYKMLPGNYDLNIANIPAGPHRLKSGNLHAWLNDMGFEEYWRQFAINNPGTPDPNKMMEAIDLYFDEVFYPALIKMDALVQQAPKKYEWKGLYIAPYLLKDAKARVKHLNKTIYPQNLKSTAGGKDVAIDQLHTMGSQAGEDLPGYRGMEVVDGQMIKAREGFGGLGVGDLTKEKAYKALNKKPVKSKRSKSKKSK
tara:strand:+ start:878 stop:2392 length:1515 start_codon:yes stop_codon:yes gene_type:complete